MNRLANDYELPEGAVLSLRHAAPGLLVRCLSGMVWVTQEGDSRDYILERGDTFRVERRGAVAVQALSSARIVAGEASAVTAA